MEGWNPMTPGARAERLASVAETKRALILDAALRVFARDGLRETSIRAIAKEAGYAPGAIYNYFPSKEHIYAAALGQSLDRLRADTEHAAAQASSPAARYRDSGLAFYDFYDTNPRDLDMGFYLFSGGLAPHGLSEEQDNRHLNAALLAALAPLRQAAEQLFDPETANRIAASTFAHASGLLLLRHTHRLHLFNLNARELMEHYLNAQLPPG